ncbi:manganese efflux pump [bacterium]|jgi:manganese efflux pump family protein|nr:manganese efflux pump [bacterium]MBT3581507.1 manganese efflux pump [bacterium]MBT4551536.1 manganese efflux pump [bacterium]MBT7088298.1 manganese efflux pump [bacterium]
MPLLTQFLIAASLAMDAFAVSIGKGIAVQNIKLRDALKLGLFFGFFQAFMPFIGAYLGARFQLLMMSFDHWIAFILLAGIGAKMIYESFQTEKSNAQLDYKTLFVLAVATSIDAMAVGLSFALLGVSLMFLVISTGLITFTLSVLGVDLGKRLGHLFQSRAEFLGGCILIIIGCKILFEHLT